MKIIITMAGESSRFRKAGFKQPKYELLINGCTMFEWAMSSLSNWFSSTEFIFVAKKGAKEFLDQKCDKLGVQYQLIELDQPTVGQGTTALIGLSNVPDNESIVIYNIDTMVSPTCLSPESIPEGCDGWIPVFFAEGTHWSFIEMNEKYRVSRVVEKERISQWGTIGFYYFSSADWFRTCFEELYGKFEDKYIKETYVAPIYQVMLNRGGVIFGHVIPTDALVPLGTPEEVLLFDEKFGDLL